MTSRSWVLAVLAMLGPGGAAMAQSPRSLELEDAHVVFDGERLVLANSRIVRAFAWNAGALATVELARRGPAATTWQLSPPASDLVPLGEAHRANGATLDMRLVPATPVRSAHIEVTVETTSDAIDVQRRCQIFPRVPAIPCTVAYRGAARAAARATIASREVIENVAISADATGDVVERLALPRGHWRFRLAAFRAATDYHDWLVEHREGELYRQPLALPGNVLTLSDDPAGHQVFLIKSAPIGADQIAWPGHDFVLRDGEVRVEGGGVAPGSLSPDEWREAYGVTVGVAGPGETALLLAMREHMATRRSYDHARDGMILMNTWGDRNRDAAMSEKFALTQLEAAHRLGLTHLQLDDGWQAGLSKNSASAAGALWEEWATESWRPHPERFPNGLGPVVARARGLGMEIGVWFNPTRTDDYALWRRDADILIDLYREHGIRIFKIDGIELPTRLAEENLARMFAAVNEATAGQAVFNLDVTAGRRAGYFHPLNQFGNVFVENRYTDWGNYYPYRTLRNLWMLALYVPPQFLQMEFLNTWRNPDRYPANDPYAPAEAGFEYAFAATMMAQPLAWFEAAALPPEAFAASELVHAYRAHAPAIHAGTILPIGEQPDGSSWTGFQSIGQQAETGYLLVLREANREAAASVATHLPPGKSVSLHRIAGAGRDAITRRTSETGALRIALPAEHSFALYRYRIVD
ncbi:alpha-galactosidase [Leptolyngbya sp. 15MV]|nr:alpha-galactosidase [Leptolyngbya sp. 15MV]